MTTACQDDLNSIYEKADAYLAKIRLRDSAEIRRMPAKGEAFLHVIIEGRTFYGKVNQFGPYIADDHGNGCSLGVASISHCQAIGGRGNDDWYVAKYRSQGRINLACLSEEGRNALAIEFGLPHYLAGEFEFPPEWALFYASPAHDALKLWLEAHPRKRKSFKPNNYLGRWAELPQEQAPSR